LEAISHPEALEEKKKVHREGRLACLSHGHRSGGPSRRMAGGARPLPVVGTLLGAGEHLNTTWMRQQRHGGSGGSLGVPLVFRGHAGRRRAKGGPGGVPEHHRVAPVPDVGRGAGVSTIRSFTVDRPFSAADGHLPLGTSPGPG
jgi:hypothetical protein